MNKNRVWALLTTMIAFTLALSGQALAVPTNGNFESGLAGWEHNEWVSERREEESGKNFAYFSENDSGERISSLSQIFNMPENAQYLKFEGRFNFPLPDPDRFSVLMTTLSDNKSTTLYYITSEPEEWPEGSRSDDLVTLDVKSFAGKRVQLKFTLDSDPANENLDSNIWLTNIEILGSIPIIPAPGALLMATIGITLVGWFRRSKTLA